MEELELLFSLKALKPWAEAPQDMVQFTSLGGGLCQRGQKSHEELLQMIAEMYVFVGRADQEKAVPSRCKLFLFPCSVTQPLKDVSPATCWSDNVREIAVIAALAQTQNL